MTAEELAILEKLRTKLFETFSSVSELTLFAENADVSKEVRSRLQVDTMEIQCHCVDLQDLLEELSNIPVEPSGSLKNMLSNIFKGKTQ